LRILDDGRFFLCIQRKYHSEFLTAQTSFIYFKHVFMVVSIIDYMFWLYFTILKCYTVMFALTVAIVLNVTL